MNEPTVVAVSLSKGHTFSKTVVESVELVAGKGVAGDAHSGETVKHRSRVAKDPSQPNLRQVHLMHNELFDELAEKGYDVHPGQLGENITTVGVDLLALPEGTKMSIGPDAEIQITGLRNPCSQIDDFQQGLLKEVLEKKADGRLERKAGVMAIVLRSGVVAPGQTIEVQLPTPPFKPLERV